MLRYLIKLDHAGQYNKVKFACLNFGALSKSMPNKLDVVSMVDRVNDLESAKKSMTNMMLRHDSEISDLRNKLEMLTDIHLLQGSYTAVLQKSKGPHKATPITSAQSKTPNVPPNAAIASAIARYQPGGTTAQVRSAESQKTNATPMVMGTISTVSDVISTPRRDGEWQTKINPRTLKQQKHNEAADQQMMQAGICPAHVNVTYDRDCRWFA